MTELSSVEKVLYEAAEVIRVTSNKRVAYHYGRLEKMIAGKEANPALIQLYEKYLREAMFDAKTGPNLGGSLPPAAPIKSTKPTPPPANTPPPPGSLWGLINVSFTDVIKGDQSIRAKAAEATENRMKKERQNPLPRPSSGYWIKLCREKLGQQQKDFFAILATAGVCDTDKVSRWETNKEVPTDDQMRGIAKLANTKWNHESTMNIVYGDRLNEVFKFLNAIACMPRDEFAERLALTLDELADYEEGYSVLPETTLKKVNENFGPYVCDFLKSQ